MGDVDEGGVLSDELEATELILQKQICVKMLGALRPFRVQCPDGLDMLHLDKKGSRCAQLQDFKANQKQKVHVRV